MQTLKESLKCAFLVALIALACYGIRLEMRAESAIGRVVLIADRTEADANQRISDLITRADVQLNGIRGLTEKRTGEALRIVRQEAASVDVQLSGARSDLNGQLTALNSTAGLLAGSYAELPGNIDAQLGTLNGTIATTAKPLQSTFEHADAVISDFPSCEDSASCPFNLFQGFAKAGERIAQSGEGIAADAKREADYLTKPQTKLQAFRAWLLAIARILGAL